MIIRILLFFVNHWLIDFKEMCSKWIDLSKCFDQTATKSIFVLNLKNNYRIIMTKRLHFRDIRVLLDCTNEQDIALACKICDGKTIFKFKNFSWNNICMRWESQQDNFINVAIPATLEIQVYNRKASKLSCVLGETKLDLGCGRTFSNQIKLCLTFDGLVVGWLYFELLIEGSQIRQNNQYLKILRLQMNFLQRGEQCSLGIRLNSKQLFRKEVRLTNRSRILYPSIDVRVKKSDLVIFQIQTPQQKMIPITFLIDRMVSGQVEVLNVWIRNSKKKSGELQLKYFLQNIYLQNKIETFNKKIDQPVTPSVQAGNNRFSVSGESVSSIRYIFPKKRTEEEFMKRRSRLKKTILGSLQLKNIVSKFQRESQDGKQIQAKFLENKAKIRFSQIR